MHRVVLFLLILTLMPSAPPVEAAPPQRVLHVIPATLKDGEVDFSRTSIFWFGRVDVSKASGAAIPGRNYADVRVTYTPTDLYVFVSMIDYYLWWYNPDFPSDGTDRTQYDALQLYLDVAGDRTAAPDSDDYRFLSGFFAFQPINSPGTTWKRDSRGTGSAWNDGWNGTWTHTIGSQWSTGSPGPNDNSGNIDYGWATTLKIPWSTLELSGPPTGQILGLGMQLFDRDAPGAGGTAAVQTWPETFDANKPDTWAGLGIGTTPQYNPPLTKPEGSVTIRRGLGNSTVIDSNVGGDGNCNGGHEGDPNSPLKRDSNPQITRGEDADMFLASQAGITDFPCFARGYLRFSLDQVPPGKVITGARLTMHMISQSGVYNAPKSGDRPSTSLIHVFSVDSTWTENGVTWNNGPLMKENQLGVLVPPRAPPANIFPGVPYTWDVTALAVQAYSGARPLDLALYSSDTEMHSNKQFTASETGDWNAVARPTLVITWGTPVAVQTKVFLPAVVR